MRNILNFWQPTAFVVMAALAIGVGCGEPDAEPLYIPEDPQELCEMACGNIYETCDMNLTYTDGARMGQNACVTACVEQDYFQGEAFCAAQASCSMEAIEACLPEKAPVADCSSLPDWDEELAEMEEQVVHIVNLRRAEGADCGTEGVFEPAPPVIGEGVLRCAARLHSKDMAERNYFEHVNPFTGETPFDRIDEAGYTGATPQGENIAAGQSSAEEVMAGWMDSDGHCSNIMNPDFNELGVGVFRDSSLDNDYGIYWTQKFGRR